MAQEAAWASCLLVSISHDPQIPQDATVGPAWMPTQELSCVAGEEHCAILSGGGYYLFLPKLFATNITLKKGPGKDQWGPCNLSIPSKTVQGILGPISRLLKLQIFISTEFTFLYSDSFWFKGFHVRLFYSLWTTVNIVLKFILVSSPFLAFMCIDALSSIAIYIFFVSHILSIS